jgi:hypothetical protein
MRRPWPSTDCCSIGIKITFRITHAVIFRLNTLMIYGISIIGFSTKCPSVAWLPL